MITNREGNLLTPSVVAFTKDYERLVGQIARRQAVTNPERTVYAIKRFMGRRYAEVKNEIAMVPYKVVARKGDAWVRIDDKEYAPPEISALVLQKLKEAAEDYLGEKVTEAVVTVPAYFNDSQRQATKDAGRIAGLNIKHIINDPMAAALAYRYGLDKKDGIIAVYDLGGSTFDISILEVRNKAIEIKATRADMYLGGDYFDQRIIDWLVSEFKREQGIDLSRDPMAMQRLKEAGEKAKCELSTVTETEINMPFITADARGPKHLLMKLTRFKLELLVEDLVERTIDPCQQAMQDAGVTANNVDAVILSSGQTRMPLVQEVVRRFFGCELHQDVSPDVVVAVGAAIQATMPTQQITRNQIFISYRRGKTAVYAELLATLLRTHFGHDQVFKDKDSIPFGRDFVEAITSAVASCDVLIALIDPEWTTVLDTSGRRRIDDPGDYVRLEVETALQRNIPVIPILVDGAAPLRTEELPPSLHGLPRRNALPLTTEALPSQINRLIEDIEQQLPGSAASEPYPGFGQGKGAAALRGGTKPSWYP